MDQPQSDDIPEGMLRTLRIIVGALAGGVFVFAAIVFALRAPGAAPGFNGTPLISFAAAGYAVGMLAVRAVAVPLIAKARARALSSNLAVTTQQLMALFTTQTIMGAALLEGGAFFLLTAYLVEQQPWAGIGGVLMGVLLAPLQAPTRERAESAFVLYRRRLRITVVQAERQSSRLLRRASL